MDTIITWADEQGGDLLKTLLSAQDTESRQRFFFCMCVGVSVYACCNLKGCERGACAGFCFSMYTICCTVCMHTDWRRPVMQDVCLLTYACYIGCKPTDIYYSYTICIPTDIYYILYTILYTYTYTINIYYVY